MGFKIESGLLDACALAILSQGDTYGYEITQSMKQAIDVSESTLYPVLRRLQKENLCRTYDRPYQGRNRRYYSVTAAGRAQLERYRREWQEHRNAIDGFLDPPGKAAEEAPRTKGSADEGAMSEARETQGKDGDSDE